jgi:hypothetical protein
MNEYKSSIRTLYVIVVVCILLAAFWTVTNFIYRSVHGHSIFIAMLIAHGAIGGVGGVAIYASLCISNLEKRIHRLEGWISSSRPSGDNT